MKNKSRPYIIPPKAAQPGNIGKQLIQGPRTNPYTRTQVGITYTGRGHNQARTE